MKALARLALLQACILAFGLILPLTVRADGMVIPKTTYAVPSIPDQRALLHYANGTETLVIETSFNGPGTNFAWVVPLPAVPTIKPVSTGLLPTLQTAFQPRVLSSVKHYWLALPIGAYLLWNIRLIRREGFFGCLVLSVVLLLVALVLPAFPKARSRSQAAGLPEPAPPLVQVLHREQVGLFDTATIQSSDPQALLHWLNEHGFATPTNIAPVLADYVREGWVFAAARLDAGADEGDSHATHPLAFTFQTAKPVYPLRLTAWGSTSCRIDLYVFGPSRAHLPGFTVQRCERPSYGASDPGPRLEPGELRIRHPELAGLVAQAPVATKLSAVLSASAMARDAYVSWGRYWPSGGTTYAAGAARILGANVCALLIIVLYLVWRLLLRVKGRVGLQAWKWGYGLVPMAVVAGVLVYYSLPKVEAASLRSARTGVWRASYDVHLLALCLGDALADPKLVAHPPTPEHPLTPAEANRLVQAIGLDINGVGPLRNHFTGEPLRFEASPGNVILRPIADAGEYPITGKRVSGYELVWHDLDGVEAITNLVVCPWRPGE